MPDGDNQAVPVGVEGTSAKHYSSDAYNEAVNAARFVKTFGIAALIYSVLSVFELPLVGAGIGIGAGLFIIRYDERRYYRVLGLIVILGAIAAIFLPVIGSTVLSGAILAKGIQVLRVLSVEGRGDQEWPATQRRALLGAVASSIGLFISVLLLVLATIGMAALLLMRESSEQ